MTFIKRMNNLNEARAHVLQDRPVYKGHTYETDCTCPLRAPAKVKLHGSWKSVCSSCGSLRQGTGT